MVIAKRLLGTPEGHFVIYGFDASLSSNSEFLDNGYAIHFLILFPIIAQRSKVAHYFHRVVGLVVNIRQWGDPFCLEFWVKLTCWSKNVNFQLMFARSASAITPSKKVPEVHYELSGEPKMNSICCL